MVTEILVVVSVVLILFSLEFKLDRSSGTFSIGLSPRNVIHLLGWIKEKYLEYMSSKKSSSSPTVTVITSPPPVKVEDPYNPI